MDKLKHDTYNFRRVNNDGTYNFDTYNFGRVINDEVFLKLYF